MPKLVTQSFVVPNKGAMPSVTGLLAPDGTLRKANNTVYTGVGRLQTRGGDRVALDSTTGLVTETAASIDVICAVTPFKDYALIVGWSSITNKVYLYTADADLTAATLVVDTNSVDHLWDNATTAPVVWVAEGLGIAYFATDDAFSGNALTFPAKTYDPATNIINRLHADLDGNLVAEDLYFRGLVSFHQHLVGWGFDMGTTYSTGYRPEYLRISGPDFLPFTDPGKAAFSIGHRVRSARESIIGACVVGDLCYIATTFQLWVLAGYGRDTWEVHCVDATRGVASARSMCAVGTYLYYWSPDGPARVTGLQNPEILRDPIWDTVDSVANPQSVVGVYDALRDRVCFVYGDSASDAEPMQMVSFDVRREAWTGPQSTLGSRVFSFGSVTPVPGATAPLPGPTGSPSNPHISLGPSDVWCQVGITAGDTHPETVTHFWIRKVGDTGWTAYAAVPATQQGFTFTNLVPNTSYEWKCWHERNGINSSELGPGPSTTFTTLP